MSMEHAKKFAEMALEDKALRQRTEKKEPAQVLAVAQELGLDFTQEELSEVMNSLNAKLDTEDLADVVGGGKSSSYARRLNDQLEIKRTFCHGDPKGPKHQYEKVGHEERWMFWFWSRGYDLYKCKLCGYEDDVRV